MTSKVTSEGSQGAAHLQQSLYKRLESTKLENEPVNANEVRLTGQGKMKNYIEYAVSLLEVLLRS